MKRQHYTIQFPSKKKRRFITKHLKKAFLKVFVLFCFLLQKYGWSQRDTTACDFFLPPENIEETFALACHTSKMEGGK